MKRKLHKYYIYTYIYYFDTSLQRKPQGYISNIPQEQVYIMIYTIAMVTRCAGQYKITALEDLSFKPRVFFDLSFYLKFASWY